MEKGRVDQIKKNGIKTRKILCGDDFMEIGGFFEFPDFEKINTKNSAHYYLTTLNKKYYFLRDGRQSIKSSLMDIKGVKDKTCFLTSYLCDSILQPFNELNLNVKFYRHDDPLIPRLGNIKDSVILIIDYFGVEAVSNNKIQELLDQGNSVILDISHSILNQNRFSIQDQNLYIISSLRKIFPIPDGGIIYYNKDKFATTDKFPVNYEKKLEAMLLRGFYLENFNLKRSTPQDDDEKLDSMLEDFYSKKPVGIKQNLEEIKRYYLSLHYEYELDKYKQESKPQNIPSLSLHILNNISISRIIEKRFENLIFLYENIKNKNLFLFNLEDIKSPFILPLRFDSETDRDKMKNLLIENAIFPPVLWDLEKYVPEKFAYERDLGKKILTIPIDQRYSPKILSKVVDVLNDYDL